MKSKGIISTFLESNFKHFNSATLVDAARTYKSFIEEGNKMFITLAGAFSTSEGGIYLSEMIREGKVHGISCTGANLEESIFNLVAHSDYERIPNYRDLTPQDEKNLFSRGMNRVTDTCIPEETAMSKIVYLILEKWQLAEAANIRNFPHEYFFSLFNDSRLEIDPSTSLDDCWLYQAYKHNIPIFVPGWEDSTIGNVFAARVMRNEIDPTIMRPGFEYMIELTHWYLETVEDGTKVGFFQLGGGIAGDFPICMVPMVNQDLRHTKELRERFGKAPYWSYFCQISDAVTSYGGYSGAVPNEKITWGKLGLRTPKFLIESDYTIVTPLIFAYVLNK